MMYENGELNPHWCQNPQYFLYFNQPTHFKIVLQRKGKLGRKNQNTQIGICFTRHKIKEEEYREISKLALMEDSGNSKGDHMKKFLLQTSQHLKAPILDKKERQLVIGPHDMYYESSFAKADLSALYFHFLPIEGPFIIIPCISKNSDAVSVDYDMTIYSNGEIFVEKLDDSRNVALVDEWEKDIAGGCHLYTEKFFQEEENQKWTQNPQYILKFDSTAPTRATIKLKLVKKKNNGGEKDTSKI